MNLAISKCVTAVKVSNFSGHYLRNRSTLDIAVLGYIDIVQHKEHSPEVWSVPPVTTCIYIFFWGDVQNKNPLFTWHVAQGQWLCEDDGCCAFVACINLCIRWASTVSRCGVVSCWAGRFTRKISVRPRDIFPFCK